MESSSGVSNLDCCEIKRALDRDLGHHWCVWFALHEEGSQCLQSPWHSLHVQGAGNNGEVGSTAMCNICTGETFLVEVKILPCHSER